MYHSLQYNGVNKNIDGSPIVNNGKVAKATTTKRETFCKVIEITVINNIESRNVKVEKMANFAKDFPLFN